MRLVPIDRDGTSGGQTGTVLPPVGTCTFKAPPREARVTARTLASRNASHRVPDEPGFRHAGTVDDPDDGTVREWELPDG